MTDIHHLKITVSKLEAELQEANRMNMQLQDSLSREQSETKTLLYQIKEKEAVVEEMKKQLADKEEENAKLFDQVQRFINSSSQSKAQPDSDKNKMIHRWVQTLTEYIPPEEVVRLQDQIKEMQQQLEEQEMELEEYRGQDGAHVGIVSDEDDYSGTLRHPKALSLENGGNHNTTNNTNSVHGIDAMDTSRRASRSPNAPHPFVSKLPLNFMVPADVVSPPPGSTEVDNMVTGRVVGGNTFAGDSFTPRAAAHLRIPVNLSSLSTLMSARVSGPGMTSVTTIPTGGTGGSTTRRLPYTGEFGATPRLSTHPYRRSLMEGNTVRNHEHNTPMGQLPREAPETAVGTTDTAIEESQRPEPLQPPVPSPVADCSKTETKEESIQKEQEAQIQQEEEDEHQETPQLVRQTIADTNTVTGSQQDELDLTRHMFGINESTERCPVCALMEQIQHAYTGKHINKERYYAVGWLPEICSRWAMEHNVVWTIEERAAVATALTHRSRLSGFNTSTYRGFVYLWRKRPFWKSAWRPVYAILQGVFLYIFNTNSPNEPVLAVIPVRSSLIELTSVSGRQRCLQISSLGCRSCVGATEGDCIETMTISVDDDVQLRAWQKALKVMQETCAHKCSSKFLGELGAFREVADMLLQLGKITARVSESRRKRVDANSTSVTSRTQSQSMIE